MLTRTQTLTLTQMGPSFGFGCAVEAKAVESLTGGIEFLFKKYKVRGSPGTVYLLFLSPHRREHTLRWTT